MLYTLCLALFLLITGMGQVGVPLPRAIHLISGICGIIAGVILLIGLF